MRKAPNEDFDKEVSSIINKAVTLYKWILEEANKKRVICAAELTASDLRPVARLNTEEIDRLFVFYGVDIEALDLGMVGDDQKREI